MAVHNIDVSDETNTPSGDTRSATSTKVDKGAVPMFGDPASYTNLSDAEKTQLTTNMKAAHAEWSGTQPHEMQVKTNG